MARETGPRLLGAVVLGDRIAAMLPVAVEGLGRGGRMATVQVMVQSKRLTRVSYGVFGVVKILYSEGEAGTYYGVVKWESEASGSVWIVLS